MFVSQGFCVFVSENVVFQKTNEIFINDAHWYVTFVHGLSSVKRLIDQIESDLKVTDGVMSTISGFYEKSELTGYVETMRSLQVEVDMLRDTYTSVYNSFDDYGTITSGDHRNKRSVLPIIGQLMSTLFGTVSEPDLENANRNINILARNQKRVIHDLNACMSVLNLTRVQVIENRRSAMDLIIVVQRLDREISALEEQFERKIVRLEQFLHTYLQFKLILDEIRLMTQDAMFYLENLKYVVFATFVNKYYFSK